MLAAADSLGCFQVESRAQMNLLPRLRPRTMHDLIVDVSLIRPGPVQGGMARAYLERRAGRAPVAYWHAALEPVLAETLGALLGLDQDVHPLALLRPQLASQGIATTRDVGTLPHGARVRVAGRVEVVQRPGTAKGMAFATLADEHGLVNLVIHPQVYPAIRSVLRHAPVVVAEGRVQHAHRVVHVVVTGATAGEASPLPVV